MRSPVLTWDIVLRACYAMPGTDKWHLAICDARCYAMLNTDPSATCYEQALKEGEGYWNWDPSAMRSSFVRQVCTAALDGDYDDQDDADGGGHDEEENGMMRMRMMRMMMMMMIVMLEMMMLWGRSWPRW
eukprot:458488-Rhodomonas_salina.6